MLIREVILENFMSYEYARVPLKDGVNVVVGPNGSGKSSFLVGICVALGDTYTERSKKLSDLIRWGKDSARVSLLLDNSVKDDGRRPITRFDNDVIRLTRTLRRDGKYGFQINQKGAQKYEVMGILRDLGFDPNNMLIIMHQNMSSQFAALSSKDKLQNLETSVGFQTYRQDIMAAKNKLGGILSEEESLNELLDRARETLGYWKDQYERLQEKKTQQTRQIFLQREMAWSRVDGYEKGLTHLEQDLDEADRKLYEAEAGIDDSNNLVTSSYNALKDFQNGLGNLVEQRVEYERTVGVCEYSIKETKERLVQIRNMISSSEKSRKAFSLSAKALRERLSSGPTTLDEYFKLFSDLEETQSEAYDSITSDLNIQRSTLDGQVDKISDKLGEAESHLGNTINKMVSTNNQIDETSNIYIESRINIALLKDQRGRLKRNIESLKGEIDRIKRDLNDAMSEALIKGDRVDTGRDPEEILGDIRKTSGILLALSNISEEAEAMYESYNRTYKELQEKIELVRANRKLVLEEIDERTSRWASVMRDMLLEVNSRYQSLLSMLQATGEVRLVDAQDIEEAGLEIWVGFKGATPSRLDPYTHSGGERSTSVMAFLLSLQQNILSPFRAVDEFDLHMDPRNKEVVSQFIVNTLQDSLDQYMAITPSQVTFKGRDVHIIMIHKTEGVTEVKVVE